MAAPILPSSQAKAILATGPSAGASVPNASGMNSWLPPQQFLAGGIGGVVTWLVVFGLNKWASVQIPPEVQTYIASGVAALIVWIVPPAQRDVVKNLNDEIIHIAQRDPASNVSYVLPPVQPPLGEPATIIPPATKA